MMQAQEKAKGWVALALVEVLALAALEAQEEEWGALEGASEVASEMASEVVLEPARVAEGRRKEGQTAW